ncbi:DedA family protein [Acanthopleuribacter pedis]|nr:VTT domain-containing protein [Acanthopleuribacter pedis]
MMGLLLVFLGSFFEGEISLVAIVWFRETLQLNWASIAGLAWLGTFLYDAFAFECGRRHGKSLRERWPALEKRAGKIFGWMERYPSFFVFVLRFQIGLRTLANGIIGQSGMSRARFLGINALAVTLWVPFVLLLAEIFRIIAGAILQAAMAG